tara:strand:+ start:207 stop:590 length:384 start_codon:yes stop_codon:yes gene_type:complete
VATSTYLEVSATVIQTTPLGSTLTRVGIGVAVSGVVVALGAVGGTAVVPWDISPVAAGISIHIDLRLHRSASNERGSGDSKSKKDLSQGSLMSLPKKIQGCRNLRKADAETAYAQKKERYPYRSFGN